MPFSLFALAASILPEIVRVAAGDRAGKVASLVTDAVRTATGTEDPELASQKLRVDPVIEANLRIQLAQIALEGERLRYEKEKNQRQTELEELNKLLADTQNARSSMVSLVRADSPIAWGAPVVSCIVTLGFFITLLIMMQGGPTDPSAKDLLNIVIGALVAAFTAVVNFWIGSSQGSRDKDATVHNLQAAQAQQAQAVIKEQSQQAQAAIQGMQRASTAATVSGGIRTPAPQELKRGGFDHCVALVLEKEGGYSDHPQDKGGPTNFGITLRTYAEFHEIPENTVTAETIKNLSQDEAKEIYRAKYWTAARCDDLPFGVNLMVFDFAVNAGVRTSIKILQEIAHVTVDGSIGPITLAAVRTCGPKDLITRFADLRLAYYRSLKNFDVFGKGWMARTFAVRDEAFQLMDAAALSLADAI